MTRLYSAQRRGLEVRREGAVPTVDGLVLYGKANADGKTIGDCPFTHSIRMVLEELNLSYELVPTTADTKPTWLVDSYQGKLPALRHKKECYVESSVILQYLLFFFGKEWEQEEEERATETAVAFFPAVAGYLKHTPDGDDADQERLEKLRQVLQDMEEHLQTVTGPYWTGSQFGIQDCRLAPQLYHLQTGVAAFKGTALQLANEFPKVHAYSQAVQSRPSFQTTSYPTSVVEWGWGNARS